MKRIILLNQAETSAKPPEAGLAATLRAEMNRLKGEFYDNSCGKIDYAAMHGSEAFLRYTAGAGLLSGLKLASLSSQEEKLAFWINIYNILVIHGIIELGIKESVREVPGFFRRIAYLIDGMTFTPDDVEHGILRGNRRPPYCIFRRFSRRDPRADHIVGSPDPRIHFTLVCGSSSCPPINYYTAEKIEAQLDLAAAGFVNGPEVEILPDGNLVRLSPIFKWYSADFGNRSGIIDFIAAYRENGDERHFLREKGITIKIEWKKYDWRLNG